MIVNVNDRFLYHGMPLKVLLIKGNYVTLENGEDVSVNDLLNFERIHDE